MHQTLQSLVSAAEAARLIETGAPLLVAAHERVLRALPRGMWIGGTIPYFMSETGGVDSRDGAFVTALPPDAEVVAVRAYGADALDRIPADEAEHGFSFALVPAFSAVHRAFAYEAYAIPGLFDRPLMGWVAGIALDEPASVPFVVDGTTGIATSEHAVVMHVALPAARTARIGIVNPFRPGTGEAIAFPQAGFSVGEVLVDGRPQSFAAFIAARGIDTRLPLVADYNGSMINVSIQSVDHAAGRVELYAPVFPDTEYRFAAPVADYPAAFARAVEAERIEPVVACNCILNYLYAELEGKRTGEVTGPMTFGEIAYVLLNQTMVYLAID